MKGQFTAVGTFETGRSARPVLVAAVLAATALVSWLVTILVDLAITAGATVAALIAVGWLLRRRNDRDTELLAERAAALQAEAAPRATPTAVHYHLHLPPGTAAADAIAALPPHQGTATGGQAS